ncbi:hypothetical protein JVT61DRAFT_3191 [Boletus reticuloceps]|uniref:Uncharacterized protein n=1 Tax=Boletus reticuloceps TaxID=495285 RepID=A0A8I3A8B3_9AGAM|nr:hypothetical protein JVT61DRAFT_3191 [Boletus reticuloceps]
MALASAASFLSSVAFHTFQKFDLPHLSRFEILAQPSTVVALLSCVNVPLNAELRLNSAIKDRSSTPDHYDLLCSLLAQTFSMSEDETQYGQTIRTSLVTFSQRRDTIIGFCTLECDSETGSLPVPGSGWDRQFSLKITHSNRYVTTNHNWERIMSYTCCPIPLSNVRTLCVSRPLYSQTSWTHILGNIPSLRYLKLSHGAMPAIAPLLSFLLVTAQTTRVDMPIEVEIRYLYRYWRCWSLKTSTFLQCCRRTYNLSTTHSPPAKTLAFDLL